MRRPADIPLARRREVAGKYEVDPRTLDRALRDGVDAIRGTMVRDRLRRALAELGVDPDELGASPLTHLAESARTSLGAA